MFRVLNILLVSMLANGRIVVGETIDPCINPRPLGSSGKRSILYDPGTCDGRLCDNYIQEGVWYTLDGETTGNRIPESCVPVWRCGTYIPIWMNGAHPTADNPGPVTVPVCAQHKVNDDCCAWRDQIRVKYCKVDALDEYYVYQLRIPPYCDMAYCGGSGNYCGSNSAWNDITTSCATSKCPVLTGQVDLSEPFISDTRVVTDINGNTFTARKFSVRCTFRYQRATAGDDDGARFDVIFEAGGTAVAKFKVVSSSTVEQSVVMDESYLAGFLDRKLKCKVSAYWQSSYPQRCATSSREVYYGIQTLDENENPVTTIPVQEGQRVKIHMKATFPVTTPGCFNLPPGTNCNPSQTFRISSQKIFLSNCTFQLSYENPRSIDIVLSPIPTIGTASGSYVWPLSFAVENSLQTEGSAVKNYKSGNVYISIIDDKQRPYCYSYSDPNINTFPTPSYPSGFYYALLKVLGDMYLVRLETRDLEIQVRQFACSPNVVCNCGVMVREGNNALGIDMCSRTSPLLIRYLVDSVNPGGTIVANNIGWTIKLPSGIEIDVYNRGFFINIYVAGLAIEKYTGLCTYTGSSEQECERLYRVPPGDSLFQITSANRPTCRQPPIIPACDCSSSSSYSVPCYTPDQSNLLLTKYSCNPTKARRKREDSNPTFNGNYIDVDDLKNTLLTGRLPDRNLTWPTPNKGITEPQATDACNNALRRAKTYELCISKINISFIIETCKTDLKGTEDVELVDIVPILLQALCLNQLTGSIVNTNNESNFNSINSQTLKDLDKFNETSCQDWCSGQGTCAKGVCHCSAEYTGKNCSINKGKAPIIETVWYMVCDIRTKSCTTMSMMASGASNTELICKIRDGKGIAFDMALSVNDKQVICNIPQSTVDSKDLMVNSTTNHTFYVSLSNDGKAFSDEQPFKIYDGRCVSLSGASEFLPKVNSCAICGRCYQADETLQLTKDDFGTCKPGVCSSRWSRANSKTCGDGYGSCSSLSRLVISNGLLSLAFVFYKAIMYSFQRVE